MNGLVDPDMLLYNLNNSESLVYNDFEFDGHIDVEDLVQFANLTYHYIQDRIRSDGAHRQDEFPQDSAMIRAIGRHFKLYITRDDSASHMISYWTFGDVILTLVRYADHWREHRGGEAPFATIHVYDSHGSEAATGYLQASDAANTSTAISIPIAKRKENLNEEQVAKAYFRA